MKLDRNINTNGKGKYALINLRTNQVQWGIQGEEDEFFVIKLKDKYAYNALMAYVLAARSDGESEFANEVWELAQRSGKFSPFCKTPD